MDTTDEIIDETKHPRWNAMWCVHITSHLITILYSKKSIHVMSSAVVPTVGRKVFPRELVSTWSVRVPLWCSSRRTICCPKGELSCLVRGENSRE